MNTLSETLFTLSNVTGTSGDEIRVRQALRPLLEGHVDELRVDAMGNLVTLKRGVGTQPLRVLVTAHMDEVGLMAVGHTSEGCLRVDTVGGIDARLLPGLEVRVGQDGIPGVLGLKAIHRAKKGEDQVTPVESLVVDIGANGKDEAARLAPVGTRATFATQARQMGELVAGKAFDDRAGCAILTQLLQGAPFPCDVYGVFTVQEEVGLRGARVAGFTVEPDMALILEGTIADDLPKDDDVSPTSQLGQGPVITVMDRSYIAAPHLVRYMVETAEALGLPYQFKQPGIGGTDAGTIHFAKGGVPCITLAVPCRYIHSPISLLDPHDLEQTLALARAALERLTPDMLTF